MIRLYLLRVGSETWFPGGLRHGGITQLRTLAYFCINSQLVLLLYEARHGASLRCYVTVTRHAGGTGRGGGGRRRNVVFGDNHNLRGSEAPHARRARRRHIFCLLPTLFYFWWQPAGQRAEQSDLAESGRAERGSGVASHSRDPHGQHCPANPLQGARVSIPGSTAVLQCSDCRENT